MYHIILQFELTFLSFTIKSENRVLDTDMDELNYFYLNSLLYQKKILFLYIYIQLQMQ